MYLLAMGAEVNQQRKKKEGMWGFRVFDCLRAKITVGEDWAAKESERFLGKITKTPPEIFLLFYFFYFFKENH